MENNWPIKVSSTFPIWKQIKAVRNPKIDELPMIAVRSHVTIFIAALWNKQASKKQARILFMILNGATYHAL